MATLQNFDAEIAKTRQVVEEMRSKIDQSAVVLDKFAKTDQKIGAADFDIENARIEDVINQQKVMEGNIADLIIGLEDATNVFGSEFESMKSYTGWETFVGIFSNEIEAAHAHRPRAQHVAGRQSAGAAVEVRHDRRHPEGAEAGSRCALQDLRRPASRQVIERRKTTMANLEATQKRIEELNPMLLDIENKIAASTSQKERTELEGERSKLATEYNERQAKEQELLAESQTLERYTSMFQTFVDSLNNQIAAQNTLINKLTIDTEQRIVLYKALEDSLKTAAQQDVAHKINTLGSKVDNAAEETMAGIGAAAQKHIGDLLELHEKNMVVDRRHPAPQEACRRRVRTPVRRGAAQAQRVGLRADDLSGAPPRFRRFPCPHRKPFPHDLPPTIPRRAISRPSPRRCAGLRSSCATTARRSTGTASSPRSSPNTSRGWRNPSPAGATASASWRASASRGPRAGFRCSRTCSSSKMTAARRRSGWPISPSADELRTEMADFILRHKEFPAALQKSMAERLYLEDVKDGTVFAPSSSRRPPRFRSIRRRCGPSTSCTGRPSTARPTCR